jgi:hypothetical protein
MIALRVEDGYGGSVELVPMAHEHAALVDVRHREDVAPNHDAHDVYLDADGLRDLARVAILAATILDEVTP